MSDTTTAPSTAPVTVCVDAAGGDRPVSTVLEGVALALEADPALTVVLTGPADQVEPFAAAHERCRAHPTTQVIAMDEHPATAVRTKRDSSIVVGCKLVRSGEAGGFFSAGSTGAVMTAATLNVGRIKGIERPALAVPLPGPKPTVLLDVGANADCKPAWLVQFARMGRAYASVVLGCTDPCVGLLNIGSEDTKGSAFAQECFAALKEELPQFKGNAEGSDLFAGTFDVIVADGFTGNVALKSFEATAKYMLSQLKEAAASSLRAKLGAGLMLPSLGGIREKMSGDVYGGALLLGVDGVVAIGHGATSPEAVMNGTRVVAEAIRGGLVAQIGARCGA
jgi:glycerol-3-phosphate acyltransferase PlsX